MEADAELLIAQRLAYEFLGRIFSAPPADHLIRSLVGEELLEDWPLESDEPDVRTGLALMREFCRDGGASPERALVQDHDRLFVTPGEAFVRPWESVYRSADHLLFDRETLEVQREYRRYGMPVPHPDREPEDHLGLELLFVAHLCGLGLEALERERLDALGRVVEAARRFVEDHLNRWAGECLGLVVERAETAFYRGAAHLARGCLAETRRILSAWELPH